MNLQPTLLIVATPDSLAGLQHRYAQALSALGTLVWSHSWEDAKARCLASVPDVCLVDVAMKTPSGESMSVALRGVASSAEFVAMGEAPPSGALIASVNEGHVRRFVDATTAPATWVEVIAQVWQEAQSARSLRQRLAALAKQRDALLAERDELLAKLKTGGNTLSDVLHDQRTARERVAAMLTSQGGRGNTVSFGDFRYRLAGELERHSRYSHPVALLQLRIAFAPGEDAAKSCSDLLVLLASVLRHIDVVTAQSEEQILVLLPVTAKDSAERVAQRVTGAIAKADRLTLKITQLNAYAYPENASAFLLPEN